MKINCKITSHSEKKCAQKKNENKNRKKRVQRVVCIKKYKRKHTKNGKSEEEEEEDDDKQQKFVVGFSLLLLLLVMFVFVKVFKAVNKQLRVSIDLIIVVLQNILYSFCWLLFLTSLLFVSVSAVALITHKT